MNVKVRIDPGSGFCSGVIKAIGKAEEYLAAHPEGLMSIGALVHNDREIERLEALGLRSGSLEDALAWKGAILIRAHGEPPSTYQALQGREVIDCSCPVVLKIQRDIAKAFAEGHAIVIFGKKGHPEVIGLNGQTGFKATVVEHADDPISMPNEAIIDIFSQTTRDPEEYKELCARLQSLWSADRQLLIHQTVCPGVVSRQAKLKTFASGCDMVFFVAGASSSNGKVLFYLCRSVNSATYFVESAAEAAAMLEDILKDKKKLSDTFAEEFSIGICGANSTPVWLLEECANEVAEAADRI